MQSHLHDSADSAKRVAAGELAVANELEDGSRVRRPGANCQKEGVGQLNVGEDRVAEDKVRGYAMDRLSADNADNLGDVCAFDGN